MEAYSYLPEEPRKAAVSLANELTGIRIRSESPVQLVFSGGDMLSGFISRAQFDEIAIALMGHSMYARQRELRESYFTLPDGSRAGVCGRFGTAGPASVQDIFSISIRIAREIKCCADPLMGEISSARGSLIISPPGMGKTTLLRDIARQLSIKGKTVCIIDERDEIAACYEGKPSMDVGPRTDVMTGLAKHDAIMKAVRASAPDVIITDEIGDAKDAAALNEALRCGVAVVASAHGTSLDITAQRPVVRNMLYEGVFDLGILLGPHTGEIYRTIRYPGKECE